jgi:hypothetical protein
MWIDSNYGYDTLAGTVGYLVQRSNSNRRSVTVTLQDRPAYTNQSREPRLTGWCGETNNVSVTGLGMARVSRVAKNGRMLVTMLHGAELSAALESTGFPELDLGE